jgi:tetratricopeptide (TPR) repeat protein
MKGFPPMPTTSRDGRSTPLIHEGWNHLQSQRPLAAWGSWQRALRTDPDSVAAQKALAALESASDLPTAARTAYRFREAVDSARRAAWDDRMRGQSDQDLDATADLFGRLATADPGDSAAWYNRALSLAWMGKNLEAIGCLDRVAGLDAERAFDLAADAWSLAEVLRHGGGAEPLADDLRFACTMAWKPDITSWLLDEFPEIQRVPTPRAPGAAAEDIPEIEVFEWLDRPVASLADHPRTAGSPPIVLASVYIGSQTLRLSSPRVENLEQVEEVLFKRLEDGADSVRREASPLPLPFLDADVWIFRVPPGLEPDLVDQLSRESVEQYFENHWIHRPRHGLDDRSPLGAGLEASRGDAVARAKLTAVVRVREQLGNRPSALLLYQGYPFDRLRRRLGLELVYPNAVDLQDLSCASGEELDRLDAATLDDSRLVEAFASATGLREDARTARLASELLKRRPAAMASLDLTALVSPLVRLAVSHDDYKAALSWLKEARSMSVGETATTLEVWRAEVFARAGRPDSAMVVYERLITPDAAGAALALDAGETMLDNGYLDQAKVLLLMAGDTARRQNRPWIERRVQQLLERIQ